MNTKKKLNCYIFSNLIISFLTFNLLTTTTTTQTLIRKNSNNVLNKIYEKSTQTIVSNVNDTLISSNEPSNVIMISNKVVQSNSTYDYVKPSYNSLTGNNLVNYALKFIGLRYVSAGRSLATGTDCSGFTSLIYQQFGITLGRTVASQVYSGTYVSKNDLQPGDLIFYSYGSVPSHVAIYIGNGQIVHESNPRDGVKVSTMNIMNYITARRIITSNVVVNQEVNVSSSTENQSVSNTKTEVVDSNVNTNNNISNQIVEDVKVEEVKVVEVVEEVVPSTNTEPNSNTVIEKNDVSSSDISSETKEKMETKEEMIENTDEIKNSNEEQNIVE